MSATPELLRQTNARRAVRQIADAAGGIGFPWATLPLLTRLQERNIISPAQRQAGERFHMTFRIAHLDPLRAADMARTVVSGGREPYETPNAGQAKRQIYGALAALGGSDSIAAGCAWHILGTDLTVRAWALREAARGRRLDEGEARGVLRAVLAVLARHYGMAPDRSREAAAKSGQPGSRTAAKA